MGRISKQIGWSQEANILYEILQEIIKLKGIISRMVTYPTTTSTTTHP